MGMLEIVYFILMLISSLFISTFLNFKFQYLIAVLLFLIIVMCKKACNGKQNSLPKYGHFVILFFSTLLGAVIILGEHIQVSDAYSGTMAENYISPYSLIDLIALVFIIFGLYEFTKYLYFFFVKYLGRKQCWSWSTRRISYKLIAVVAICLFVLWLPYLFVYFPGYVFGDTLSSVAQAMGSVPLSNHHPVLYTFFIKLCLKVGVFLGGGNTLGCVVYCVIQMAYMSTGVAYLICWLYQRIDLSRRILAILILFYGVIPYFAQMSIAMWKDPVFAVTLVVITVMLMEVILSQGEVLRKNPSFWIVYIFMQFILIFVRNNGIYIAFFDSFVLIIMYLFTRKSAVDAYLKKLGMCTVFIVILSQMVIGPVYDHFNIGKEKVESYGIFLNQMARVVACDGDMSKEDRDYMEQLLPLELYDSTYRPCCVDLLKWDSNFNAAVLEDGFWERYFSMLVKNPRIFFEGWELQTYGFWTVNCDEINYYPNNIEGGVPRNYYPEYYQEELMYYDIQAGTYVNDPILTKIFPISDPAIPVGIINWGVIFLIAIMIIRKQKLLLLVLAPSVGLMITLIVASPISYWPRYGAAVQYLVPFYIALLYVVFNRKLQKEERENGQNSCVDSML